MRPKPHILRRTTEGLSEHSEATLKNTKRKSSEQMEKDLIPWSFSPFLLTSFESIFDNKTALAICERLRKRLTSCWSVASFSDSNSYNFFPKSTFRACLSGSWISKGWDLLAWKFWLWISHLEPPGLTSGAVYLIQTSGFLFSKLLLSSNYKGFFRWYVFILDRMRNGF